MPACWSTTDWSATDSPPPHRTPSAAAADRPHRDRQAEGRRRIRVLLVLLALGAVLAQSGRLEPGDERLESGEFYDVHPYPAQAGDSLVLTLTSSDFDPYLMVIDPDGAVLTQIDDSPGYGLDVHLTLTLPSSGTYLLAVTSARPGETGAYELTLESGAANPAAPQASDPPPSAAPSGANPLAPAAANWSGLFSDGTLTVELRANGTEVTGRLHFGGRDYQLSATITADTLQGTFGADGQTFPFSALLDGEVLDLDSEGNRFRLERRPETESASGSADILPPAPDAPFASAAPYARPFFFLPSDADGPHNTTRPRLETDAAGNIHLVAPGYAGGNAYYLFCPADCSDPAQMSTVVLPTDGTAHNAMIALDPGGTPQVLIGGYGAVYYATCSGDCRQQSAWRVSRIVQHSPDADREVTGEAFTLDPQGRPRFVMHAYRAFLGIAAPEPVTLYVACDVDCHTPLNWRQSRLSDQILQESTLRFSADGRAHLATVAISEIGELGGYLTCASDCESGRDDAWQGLGLTRAFSDRSIERIDPAISLALTSDGRPRIMLLGRDESGARDLSFWACDAADCRSEDAWRANYLIADETLSAGLDLTLDGHDRPRAVYNADDNIFLLLCDGDCLHDDDGGWRLLPVELAGNIPTDSVIPYHNCNIAAWLLRYPSLALGPDALPRVAYLAEDISGVLGVQDPRYPACTPGLDMSIGRFARLGSLEPR